MIRQTIPGGTGKRWLQFAVLVTLAGFLPFPLAAGDALAARAAADSTTHSAPDSHEQPVPDDLVESLPDWNGVTTSRGDTLSPMVQANLPRLMNERTDPDRFILPDVWFKSTERDSTLPDSVAELVLVDGLRRLVVHSERGVKLHFHTRPNPFGWPRYHARLPAGQQKLSIGYTHHPALEHEMDLPGGTRTFCTTRMLLVIPGKGVQFDRDDQERAVEGSEHYIVHGPSYEDHLFQSFSGQDQGGKRQSPLPFPSDRYQLSEVGRVFVRSLDEWPAVALERELFGSVTVQFDVLHDGQINNVAVVVSDHPEVPGFAEAALRDVNENFWWFPHPHYNHAPYRVFNVYRYDERQYRKLSSMNASE